MWGGGPLSVPYSSVWSQLRVSGLGMKLLQFCRIFATDLVDLRVHLKIRVASTILIIANQVRTGPVAKIQQNPYYSDSPGQIIGRKWNDWKMKWK